jgi:NitT/TauT family transport system ATP-binding protein
MTANRLRQEFARLVRDNNKTAVFITHSINEALEIGDRIVVLRRPARIACDIMLPRNADIVTHGEIRGRIEAVLAE